MNFVDSIKLGFSNYVNFTDRACRSEYWYWVLFYFVGEAVCALVDYLLFGHPGVLYSIFELGLFLPTLAVAVRRLHDTDRGGWWILLGLIPLVGWIILLVWYCSKGTDGPNRFGQDRLMGMAPPIPRPGA